MLMGYREEIQMDEDMINKPMPMCIFVGKKDQNIENTIDTLLK